MSHRLALTPAEQADFEEFKARVRRRTGLDLSLYSEAQMHRRLAGLLERARVDSFAAYSQLIESDPAELSAFLDRLTIHVSALFRNPEKWLELREQVLLPAAALGRALRVWSAGCSFGAEPFSLAMLLDDVAPRQRHYLLATDVDPSILDRARRGVFSEQEIQSVPPRYRHSYLTPQPDGFHAAERLRERITFRQHDLLRDPFETGFDLIVCRNVVIYFTEEAKGALFRRFAASLRPGGHLFLGSTERMPNARELGFSSPVPFLYRREA